MARVLGLLPSALIAARGGMSGNAFYRELRRLGMGARRSEILELYGHARSIVSRTPEEPFRDIRQVPLASEMSAWPSKNATGIVQNVTLLYRDRVTGHIQRTYYRTVSDTGITRERAMAMATAAYSDHAESYDQDIIGAIHTSAYNLVPGLVQ